MVQDGRFGEGRLNQSPEFRIETVLLSKAIYLLKKKNQTAWSLLLYIEIQEDYKEEI